MRKEQARVDLQRERRRAMLVASGCKGRMKERKWMRRCSVERRKRRKVQWQATCIRNETWKVEKPEKGWTRGSVHEKGGDRWALKHRLSDLCPTSLGLRLLQAPWTDRHQQQEVVG